MNVVVSKTKAEQQLAEQFEARAARLPGAGWVREARRKAIGAFAAFGLPSRRSEAWRYSDLRARWKQVFAAAALDPGTFDPALIDAALGPELAKLDCIRMLFVNGTFLRAEMPASEAPGEAYRFDPLSSCLGQPSADWMRPIFQRPARSSEDAALTLNTAFMSDGAVLAVLEGKTPARPLHLVFLTAGEAPASSVMRNLIEVRKGASAVILETHVAMGTAPCHTNSATEIRLHEAARVEHIRLVREGPAAIHLGTLTASIGANACYQAFQLALDSGFVRNGLNVAFDGPGGRFDLAAVMLAGKGEHIDTTLVVEHKLPGCTSRELVKAVLGPASQGVFQGKVIVAEDAQKSDGKQMAQALLLAEDAEFDSKPELEIYADDVICGHGSTAAQIDEELLFYCQSRGIPRQAARALLIEAFVGEALDKIDNDEIRAAVGAIATDWLNAGKV